MWHGLIIKHGQGTSNRGYALKSDTPYPIIKRCLEVTRLMSTRRYKVLLTWDSDDKVWVSYVPTLGWLSTFGETQEVALRHTKEAVLGYLEAAEKGEKYLC